VGPTPVLAAGGIGDGRGLAAALALGAAGAVIGTRFCVAEESLMHPEAKQRIESARGSDTVRTRAFDDVRGLAWPERFTGRALRNDFVEHWYESDGASWNEADERDRYLAAVRAGDFDTAAIYAGEVVDLVDRMEPARDIAKRVGSEAEDRLRRISELLG
jgi:nitronate monooxygenase